MSKPDFATTPKGDLLKQGLRCRIDGGWADDDERVYCFRDGTGAVMEFSADEMRGDEWWQCLPEAEVLSIEAHLYPMSRADPAVYYVARSDAAAGGLLQPGSLLSGFFEGGNRRAGAGAALDALKAQWPDAAIFMADSVTDAQRLLSASDPAGEGVKLIAERMARARAARALAR